VIEVFLSSFSSLASVFWNFLGYGIKTQLIPSQVILIPAPKNCEKAREEVKTESTASVYVMKTLYNTTMHFRNILTSCIT